MRTTNKHGETQEAGISTLDLFAPRDGQDSGQGQDEAGTEAQRSSNRETILELLSRRGERGITNIELNEVCFRYGARIFELRRMGHAIETTPEGEGVFRFTLSEPGLAHGASEQPRKARNGRQVRPRQSSAAVQGTVATTGGDAETGGELTTKAGEPYKLGSLDMAHAMLLTRRFAEHPFRVRGGVAMCPACSTQMVRAEKQEGFAQHFVCLRSGVVFYGDAEGLKLCLHPADDVAGAIQRDFTEGKHVLRGALLGVAS